MKKHVFYTWMLGHALHPLAMAGMILVRNTEGLDIGFEFVIIFWISVAALLISIPGLLVCWIVMPGILRFRSSLLSRFFTWLISGSVIVMINAIVPVMLCGMINIKDLFLLMPSVVAAFIAICIRFQPFIRLAGKYDQPEEPELR